MDDGRDAVTATASVACIFTTGPDTRPLLAHPSLLCRCSPLCMYAYVVRTLEHLHAGQACRTYFRYHISARSGRVIDSTRISPHVPPGTVPRRVYQNGGEKSDSRSGDQTTTRSFHPCRRRPVVPARGGGQGGGGESKVRGHVLPQPPPPPTLPLTARTPGLWKQNATLRLLSPFLLRVYPTVPDTRYTSDTIERPRIEEEPNEENCASRIREITSP